ncbi:DUF2971 domain-containing protein [Vibrio splendidus]|uniref:DUF2971 domain-containing protein n=1 Tax=Vibrio splendidus TaxID=29497 RepID=A0ABV4LZY9_VIBSP
MFKYYTFTEYAVTNILNNELYMNHYESFNDPFECWCSISTGFPSIEGTSSRLEDILKAWGFDSLDDPDAKENYALYTESLVGSEPDVMGVIDHARITCFSKRPDNLLMWSHYANGLRGFCLEFDPYLVLFNNPNFAEIYEVNYQANPPEIDTAVLAVVMKQINYHSCALEDVSCDNEAEPYENALDASLSHSKDIYKKMLATKPLDWKYEEELRIIYQSSCNKKSAQFLKYPPQAIKSVIFGEKMPDKQRHALKALFERNIRDIEFKVAKRTKGSFQVTLENGI